MSRIAKLTFPPAQYFDNKPDVAVRRMVTAALQNRSVVHSNLLVVQSPNKPVEAFESEWAWLNWLTKNCPSNLRVLILLMGKYTGVNAGQMAKIVMQATCSRIFMDDVDTFLANPKIAREFLNDIGIIC